VLSGRALRALSGKRSSNLAKRTTETPCPTGAPLRAAPKVSRKANAPRARQVGAAAGQRPD